ncbi:unnamed protein product [Echinostoma caproni]|uniref:DUF1618 domain-containing protein n=1 Tax=Echinostoma caproni TaxID=27848 RepID=A0A183AE35_9TREM|nr:unnamed protein product [Echinostoma caproni]
MPPPYGQPTDQLTNSKHSSNEYFIVQPGDGSENQQLDGRSGSANRCPGCPAAFHPHAHRALNLESRAYNDNSHLSDACVPTYRAYMDKWVYVNDLSRHLGEYLDVDPRCVKVSKGCFSPFGSGPLRSHSEVVVSVTPCIDSTDVSLSVNVLDLTGILNLSSVTSPVASSPLWAEPLQILCQINWTVDHVIDVAAVMLQKIYQLEIPRHRLCLRKCTLPECSPGPLLDPNSQLASFRNPHQGVLLQLLDDRLSPFSIPLETLEVVH